MSAKKKANKKKQHVDEPKSAHATPVVENYVEKRIEKAEKQIVHEEQTKKDSTNPVFTVNTGYYLVF